MPPPFRKIAIAQFEALVHEFPFRRRVNAVHMHHTWRPNHAQFNGDATIVGMWRTHTAENGWRDIAQHLTIDPEGGLWLGRGWNLPPASAGGHNGTSAAGPFMFEMIGDFDVGRDPFAGLQKDHALRVVAILQDRFDLPAASLKFHNQMSGKTCPGSAISYEETLEAVRALRSRERVAVAAVPSGRVEPGSENAIGGNVLDDAGEAPASSGAGAPLGDGDAAVRGRPAARRRTGSRGSADPARSGGVDDIVLGLLRDESTILDAPESPFAEPAERQGWTGEAPESTPIAGPDVGLPRSAPGAEGLFDRQSMGTEMKETLRGHIVNLSRGRLSLGGLHRTTADDVDAIFERLHRLVEGRSATDPLRIVVWAHGGLIDEASGLLIAHKHVNWWLGNGVYPLYFVWETGLFDALGRLLAGRSGGEEALLRGRLSDLTDRGVEALARVSGGPAIWSDMKQSARLAIDPDDGGAAYAARKLANFCGRHADAVELHAVGHSAGAIFHASFLPAAIEAGVPHFRSLTLLAPAIRVDRFRERLAPLVGEDKPIARVTMFTMNRLRESDDTSLGIYRKSLLYLIHHALEPEPECPILGLEDSVRSDPSLKALFGLGGAEDGAGEVVWSKSPSGAPPHSRSTSTTHGGFDDDGPTMDSVLRRILGRDEIALHYGHAAAPGATTETGDVPDVLFGDEAAAPLLPDSAEEYGVPFAVLDAFERATDLADDGVEAPGLGGIEGVAEPSIGFGTSARAADVTPFSLKVLADVMRRAGVPSVLVSSTSRSPAEQGRVMFANLERYGVAHQKALYGPSGDRVIDVYARGKAAGRDAKAIRALMAQEIVRIGPTRVSRHASDPKVLNVFDVAPSSVARKAAFEQAILAEPRVAKFLKPPQDPGYHLEIPQPPAGPRLV